MNTTISPNYTTTGTYTTPVTTNTVNFQPWVYPTYPQYYSYPYYVDRELISWKCGDCKSSCAGYLLAKDAENALASHRRSCGKAK